MSGHSNNTIKGETILWPDASLDRLDAGYEEFIVSVREDAGGTKMVHCLGYIGFQMVGFWDEVIIETATIHSNHPFIADCERRVKSFPESGAQTRLWTGNFLLEITL